MQQWSEADLVDLIKKFQKQDLDERTRNDLNQFQDYLRSKIKSNVMYILNNQDKTNKSLVKQLVINQAEDAKKWNSMFNNEIQLVDDSKYYTMHYTNVIKVVRKLARKFKLAGKRNLTDDDLQPIYECIDELRS